LGNATKVTLKSHCEDRVIEDQGILNFDGPMTRWPDHPMIHGFAAITKVMRGKNFWYALV